jgi:hypothetical protein
MSTIREKPQITATSVNIRRTPRLARMSAGTCTKSRASRSVIGRPNAALPRNSSAITTEPSTGCSR